jgi:hypothetical protein
VGVKRRCATNWKTGIEKKYKRGQLLGISYPQSRVPLIRPRRDRIMGSSILASLSEAGGNDPYHPMQGPLPPRASNDMDRVGTRPMHCPRASQWPKPIDKIKPAPAYFQQFEEGPQTLSSLPGRRQNQYGKQCPRLELPRFPSRSPKHLQASRTRAH